MHLAEIGLSFIEGLALIASPCILPVLPLILSTSVDGGRRRPFGVITGFILAFSTFALLSRELVNLLHINLDYIKYGSLTLLICFGIIMLFEPLINRFAIITSRIANTGNNLSRTQKDGYLSGILIGVLIGLVWTPCAGPILAAALVQIIRAQNQLIVLLLIFAFALGAGLPMLIISLTGRKLIAKLRFLNTHAHITHKVIGVIILISAGVIISGFNPQDLYSAPNLTQPISNKVFENRLQNALSSPYPAPDFASSDVWLNTSNDTPLTKDALKGKVVLVDFWTYSCINCLRTLPYIKSWYEKYHNQGLVIVGVHAPEFEFEKNKDNVVAAIARYGIMYPVAIDNNLDTWTNYNNRYWPAHYLIDKNGMVVYTSFGEGDYGVTENNIRVLLGLNRDNLNDSETATFNQTQTPETYLGYARANSFASPQTINNIEEIAKYSYPATLAADSWALSGNWLIQQQKIVSEGSHSKLELNFSARHVYLVLGSANGKEINLSLKLNGKPLDKKNSGKDVVDNNILKVQDQRLYEIIDQGKFANGLLEIEVSEPGLEAYAFTFGQ